MSARLNVYQITLSVINTTNIYLQFVSKQSRSFSSERQERTKATCASRRKNKFPVCKSTSIARSQLTTRDTRTSSIQTIRPKRCELLMHDTDRSPHPASSTGHGLTLHLRSAINCSPSDRYETLHTYLPFSFLWPLFNSQALSSNRIAFTFTLFDIYYCLIATIVLYVLSKFLKHFMMYHMA